MTHRTRVSALLLVVSMAAGACGPDVPLEVGVRDYSTDIVYGSQRQPPPLPPPVPAANPEPGFPGFIVPPPPIVVTQQPGSEPAPRPVPPPPAAACPTDDPLDFPRQPATRTVSGPPAAGVYLFRQQGTVSIAGQPAQALPAESSREVRNVVPAANNEVTYDVVIESLGDVTTSSYAARQSTGDPSLDGVFLTRVVTRRANGGVDEFTPTRGVRIIAVPAGPAASWNDVGTDPLRATSMVVQGQVTDKGRVNACGTPLDSWTVKVTGRLLGPGKDLTVTATYQVATQFGGFVLADDVAITGTDGGVRVDLRSAATVNAIEPRPPRNAQ